MKRRADLLPAIAEIFREHGFEAASMTLIGQRAGLGKSSLYHFFPGGKEEMAAGVLEQIDAWFETEMFRPLRENGNATTAIRAMIAATDAYFRSGDRVCLVGAFALGAVRDRFSKRIEDYFVAWRDALAEALIRGGLGAADAAERAEDAVAAIQGNLVAARALGDPALFQRGLVRIELRLLVGLDRSRDG